MENEKSVKASKPIYKRWWFWVISLLIFGLIIQVIFKDEIELENQKKQAEIERQDSIKQEKIRIQDSIKTYAMEQFKSLEISNWTWKKGGFGAVALVNNIKIKNKGNWTWKDLKVKIDFKGESGTVLNTRTEILTFIIKPGETKTIKEINMGFVDEQTTQASIEIIDGTLIED